MPNNRPSNQSRPHQVLDSRLLGRPVHLLPRFAAQFSDSLAALMAAPNGRRYWSGFQIDGARFQRGPAGLPARWLGLAGREGSLGFAFDRALLIALLEARYGRKDTPAALRQPGDERVSATEERLAAVLARQLGDTLAACIGMRLDSAAPHTAVAPGASNWVLELVLRAPGGAQAQQAGDGALADHAGGDTARCWIALEQPLMNMILAVLAPQRPAARRPRAEPLANTLKVKLDGRLLSKEITLEALFDLRVGDVIPVSVERADVVLDEACLFTASVAEHKGKLCLTSFEDAE